MKHKRKLEKKRTRILDFVEGREDKAAIMEGIDAGLEDVKAGRVHSHDEVMTYINQKFRLDKRKTILDLVEQLSPNDIDPKADLKELYHLNQKHGG